MNGHCCFAGCDLRECGCCKNVVFHYRDDCPELQKEAEVLDLLRKERE